MMNSNFLINLIAVAFILIGSLGILYCLNYMFSVRYYGVFGDGFVGGAILCASGLITLAINNRKK